MRYSKLANKTQYWVSKVQSRWSQCLHKADSRAATIRRLAAENAELRRRLDDANGIAHEAAELSVDAMESNRELRRENAELRRRLEEAEKATGAER